MLTMQQEQGLAIARMLVKAGVPVFLAQPDPGSAQGFRLPYGWERCEPDVSVVDAWQPGWGLCAVMGRTFDLVDIDPRSGGTEAAIPMPQSYLTAETPSGGRHHFVRALGVPSRDGVAPGVDLKSGTLEGSGRGFAFIAPTVRRSKVDGAEREYRWHLGPDGPALPTPDALAADGTGVLLRARVMELRRLGPAQDQPRRIAESAARREFETAVQRLSAEIRHWAATGWGGEAHAGLLAATTHLARLNPDQAPDAFAWAFRNAGVEPDVNDVAKLESALNKAVPDIIVPDDQITGPDAFFLGGGNPLGQIGAASGLLGAAAVPDVQRGVGVEILENGQQRRRFQPMSRAEAASIEAPAALVDGLLLSNTKARISAPPGAGKTWVVLDLAAHVAAGLPWQGREATRCRVLYVAGEGAPSFDSRISAWEAKHGCAAEVDILPDAPQVGNESWDEFLLEIRELNYGLVIFDTQSTITVGLEENSNKDANIALLRLDQVRRINGACVLVVHHTGHEENGRARGASAWLGGLDTELVLSGSSVKDLQLKSAKQKYIESGKPIRLSLEKAGPGLVVTPKQAAQNDADGFFEAPGRAAEVWALVTALEEFDGAQAHHSMRHLTAVIRAEMGRGGSDNDIRDAIRAFKVRAGIQGIVAPEWLMRWASDQRGVDDQASDQRGVDDQASDQRGGSQSKIAATPVDLWA